MTWLDAQGQAWQDAARAGRALVLDLPYPPSLNHSYRAAVTTSKRTGLVVARQVKSFTAKAYTETVVWHVHIAKARRRISVPVAMMVCARPPDATRRDVANLEKVLTDALVKAGVLVNDELVHDMRLVWAPSAYGLHRPEPGVEVSIRPLLPAEFNSRTAWKQQATTTVKNI